MFACYLDSSALVKRYTTEPGSTILNMIFDDVDRERIFVPIWSIAEAIAALNRKKNSAQISAETLAATIHLLLDETEPCWKPKIDNSSVRDSLNLITQHNINATDALHLHTALNLRNLFRPYRVNLILVTSDQRLLRAAKAEGLAAIDPEQISASELKKLL